MLLIARRHWMAVLHWALWVNSWHDRLYWRLIHGDKVAGACAWRAGGACMHAQLLEAP
jgi:hypothetical protein